MDLGSVSLISYTGTKGSLEVLVMLVSCYTHLVTIINMPQLSVRLTSPQCASVQHKYIIGDLIAIANDYIGGV